MRVVFFGSPEAALPSIRALRGAGHEIPLIVAQPDRPAGRGKKLLPGPVKRFALEHEIPMVQPEKIRQDPEILDRLRAAEPDIQVVVAYGQIIPMPVIALPRFWTINVHFSILPRYRGAAPVAAAIAAGETRTGVTIFRLDQKIDEGDVLSGEETAIGPAETAGELEARLAELGAGLLLRTLAQIETIVPRPQDHSQATLAPKLRKEDGLLNWGKTAVEIDRRVRAMTPRPSAYTHLHEGRLIVLAGCPEEGVASPAHQGPPGTIAGLSKTGISVACGGGTRYLITRLNPENRVEMAAAAFILGGGIQTGDLLE
ncbi:MAG: methionyl-tRNA formyltransferase [Candidatus Aminicenantes bacterium]|nr:methionyl-tRNA formyltransferase [Candidatus Aminicenantes bacterium]